MPKKNSSVVLCIDTDDITMYYIVFGNGEVIGK